MKKSKSKKGKATLIKVNVIPKFNENIKRIYSNYVNVSRTPHNLVLRFGDTPPVDEFNLEQVKKTKTIESPIISEVILPFEVGDGLIKALKSQLKKASKK